MQADFYAPQGAAVKKGRLVSKMLNVAEKISSFAPRLADNGVLDFFDKYYGNVVDSSAIISRLKL